MEKNKHLIDRRKEVCARGVHYYETAIRVRVIKGRGARVKYTECKFCGIPKI